MKVPPPPPSYEDLQKQIWKLSNENERLKEELAQLKRLIFGSKRERFISDTPPEQLTFDFDENKEDGDTVIPVTETINYERHKPKKKPKRQAFPEHLPREVIIIEPEEDTTGMKRIGEKVTETLDYRPAKLIVIRRVRPKYVDPDNEAAGVLIGTLPARPIEKSIAEAGLLANVIVEKYVDHLPLYRQVKRFERQGIQLSISTMTDWIAAICQLLAPLYDCLKQIVLNSNYIQADETTIKVLDGRKKGKTHTGYHWGYHAPLLKLLFFDYQQTRGRAGPARILKNFSGYLQTDGYIAYDDFDLRPDISLFHCMAHARRYFDKAKDNDPQRATYALTEIQKLYHLERAMRLDFPDISFEQRHSLRKKYAVPVLESLGKWLEQNQKQVLPKSAIGVAINYSLLRWKKLSFYASDGRFEIDNNLIENTIRPIALGRKNYLFAGSHEGAKRAAILYSFLGSCKLQGVNPFDWLRDVLTRIPEHPVNRIEELLPHRWKSSPHSDPMSDLEISTDVNFDELQAAALDLT